MSWLEGDGLLEVLVLGELDDEDGVLRFSEPHQRPSRTPIPRRHGGGRDVIATRSGGHDDRASTPIRLVDDRFTPDGDALRIAKAQALPTLLSGSWYGDWAGAEFGICGVCGFSARMDNDPR
jgi:hypothetical protein